MVTDAPADDNKTDTTHFVFVDGLIKLRHLQMNGGPVIVDQCQCMAFLTAGADPFAMREDPIIQKEWPLLKKIAKATNVVDMYDSSTWDGIDFEPVLDIVHRQIATHANQRQICRWRQKSKNAQKRRIEARINEILGHPILICSPWN